MTPKTLVGSKKLGEKIRTRWLELDLTIEEVALRAGIGTKTWRRYEAGESIRMDKRRGSGGPVPSSEAKRARNVAGIFKRAVRDTGGGNVCYGQLEVS